MRLQIFFSIVIFFSSAKSIAQNPVFLWETEPVLSGPESVVFDPIRNLLYVSNLRKERQSDVFYGQEFISKINLDGKVVDLRWIENLSEPTGMCIFNDQLYIVERFGLVVYDLKTDRVDRKIRIPSNGFINDVTLGADSTIYVSDSSTETIFTVKNDRVSTWYSHPEISHPNGILYHNGMLLIDVNGDSTLKALDVTTHELREIAQLEKGIIDGIKVIEDDYLVSFLEGSLYRITENGKVTEILNTRDLPIHMADIEYIENRKLLILPAIWQHKLVAYQLE